jgi:hypothetical protein
MGIPIIVLAAFFDQESHPTGADGTKIYIGEWDVSAHRAR